MKNLMIVMFASILISGCLTPGGQGALSSQGLSSLVTSVASLSSAASSSKKNSSLSSVTSSSSLVSSASSSSVISIIPSSSSSSAGVASLATNGYYLAVKASAAPVIDGNGNDACWANAAWGSIGYLWMGAGVTAADFSGRFKVTWNADALYILAEITDDVSKAEANELASYWMGDCLEIFLDENRSGGDHLYTYNAFAYHVAQATGLVYDLDTDHNAKTYNHVTTAIVTNGYTFTWEMSMRVYGDSFTYGAASTPVVLGAGRQMGFTMAYCDNDAGNSRQSFLGSKSTHGVNNDEGYKTSSVFGLLELTN